jgi:N utilization substance protein B
MINRILIRTKVVQMLYSYLLTRSEFKIQSAPETTSRDKKYAYALYLDLLLLILELSGHPVKNNTKSLPLASIDSRLSSGKMAKALSLDNSIRSIILKGNTHVSDFDSIAQKIHDLILESGAYRDYKKVKSPEIADDVKLWTSVLNSLIVKNEEFIAILRTNEAFTNVGFEEGVKMLTSTLNSYNESNSSLFQAKRNLETSLEKAYELYISVFVLIQELTRAQEERIENNKCKYLATHEDLNPNMKMVDNLLVEKLNNNTSLQEYLKQNPISWNDDPIFIKSILEKILSSEIYANYIAKPANDLASDCDFWKDVLKNIIFVSDEFTDALESRSVYWNDDLIIMGTFVLKTIKQISTDTDNSVTLLPRYKDEEDEKFGPELFMLAIKNRELYRSYIDKFINNQEWDPERLAFMDIVVMLTAITELLNYPLIPIPVTMNEYIEIANNYSTSRSGSFINGILYSVINYLKSEGLLNKN